jgi:hypothetical protein
MATSSPFAIAERYIQLRSIYAPESWGDVMMRINELILTPLITIFFIFLDGSDFMTVLPAFANTVRNWISFLDYQRLRFVMQRMYLQTMVMGGPFIVTNDPKYLPYVYADAVVRRDMRHQHSAKDRLREGPWKHTQ